MVVGCHVGGARVLSASSANVPLYPIADKYLYAAHDIVLTLNNIFNYTGFHVCLQLIWIWYEAFQKLSFIRH